MSNYVKDIARRLRRLVCGSGRHRAGRSLVMPFGPVLPPGRFDAPCPAAAPTDRPRCEPIDGASTPLVRPYLTAYEQEEKARIQRLRRDILWCATHGIDLDTRDIHACSGAAS